jgi:hypothetical protein
VNRDKLYSFFRWLGWLAVVGLLVDYWQRHRRRRPAKLLRGAEWATKVVPYDFLDGSSDDLEVVPHDA